MRDGKGEDGDEQVRERSFDPWLPIRDGKNEGGEEDEVANEGERQLTMRRGLGGSEGNGSGSQEEEVREDEGETDRDHDLREGDGGATQLGRAEQVQRCGGQEG